MRCGDNTVQSQKEKYKTGAEQTCTFKTEAGLCAIEE